MMPAIATAWFWFWVAIAVIFVVGEIFTAGFFLLPFGIGAAASALAAWLGVGLAWQWVIFISVSVPILLVVKWFADRVTEGADLRVAGDRMVGQAAVVIERLRGRGVGGRVRVGSEEWRARDEGDGEVPVGTEVEVLKVDGTHLVVRSRSAGRQGGVS